MSEVVMLLSGNLNISGAQVTLASGLFVDISGQVASGLGVNIQSGIFLASGQGGPASGIGVTTSVSGDIVSVSGAVSVSGNQLSLTGGVQISGAVQVSGTVSVTSGLGVLISGQMVQVASGMFIASGVGVLVPITSGSIIVSGNVSVSGSVTVISGIVTGSVQVSGTVGVSGAVGATVSGSVQVSGTVSVSGQVLVTSGTMLPVYNTSGVYIFGYQYSLISGANIVNVQSGASVLHAININTWVSGGWIMVMDSLSGNIGASVAQISFNEVGTLSQVGIPPNPMIYDVYMKSGIVIITSGAAINATVSFRNPV